MHNEIKWICLIINCEADIRAFALAHAKMYVYFNIRTYFFIFYILTFQNTLRQIIYFTLHFIKISFFFLNFLIFYIYSHTQ